MLNRRHFIAGVTALAGAGAARRQASAQNAPPVTRVAFGSCAHQDKPQPIWDAVLAYKPEVYVFAGDNVYGDVSSADMTELKQAYAKARTIDGYMRVRRETPVVLATWDDHDYGSNDDGAAFAHRRLAQQIFADFWELPADDPRRRRDGIHHAWATGAPGQRLQIILLDTRFFRSALRPTDARGQPGKERYVPDADPAKTVLGDEQWRWLEVQLGEPADLRLIVTSIQVLADGHGWERWGNLPLERQRLYDLIAACRASGVVFLSGDRHFGGIYRRSDGLAYPLHEITSSGINMVYWSVREPDAARLGAPYAAANFGTIDIDWWAGEVALSVRAIGGEPVRRVTLSLASLRG
ncbi:MAG: alkaline phosphatase family protein [Alphaproteobacteria bacterium]|nr:alkaline phosphatase family protein [Alphaproteobacteria bacterium]